jgi:hypothetical protein
MKHIATAALMLNLGVAGIYAEQKPVKQKFVQMTFSGSTAATTLNLQPDTVTDEEHFAGSSTLGQFTFRQLRADKTTPQPSPSCSGPKINISVARGAGVFRFQDGSLLTARITEGALCIDLTVPVGRLTVAYQITGGTRRFKDASGALTLTSTLRPVLFSATNAATLLTNTGQIKGTIFGAALEEEGQDEQQ